MSNESNENSGEKYDLSSDIDVSSDNGLSQIDNIFNFSASNIPPLLMILVVISS